MTCTVRCKAKRQETGDLYGTLQGEETYTLKEQDVYVSAGGDAVLPY